MLLSALPRFVGSNIKVGHPLTLSSAFTGTPGYTIWRRGIFGGVVTLQSSSTYRVTDEVIENGTATIFKGTLEMNTTDTTGHYSCYFYSRRRDAQDWTVSYQTGKLGGRER